MIIHKYSDLLLIHSNPALKRWIGNISFLYQVPFDLKFNAEFHPEHLNSREVEIYLDFRN